MKILLIGNGFDLEHNLATRYTDFLKFIEKFEGAYTLAYGDSKDFGKIEDDYMKLIFSNQNFEDLVNTFHVLIENNLWIQYFKNAYHNCMFRKENWIDFESEISSVIKDLDGLIKCYEGLSESRNTADNNSYQSLYRIRLLKIIGKERLTQDKAKDNTSILLYDLKRLISALEIYICNYVGGRNIEYYNPDIVDINPDKVLSFNYSDTYKRVYADGGCGIEYCFVHGEAMSKKQFISLGKDVTDRKKKDCIEKYIEDNNMVLGIDEYLDKDARNKEVELIGFKKFYQRIYKKTGNEYKKWLQQIDENVTEGRKEENVLYIFGHSLDVTDGDILREMMNHPNLKTVIFYRNKIQLGQQIANLVKILNCDNLIEKVYGNNPAIVFKLQKKRKLIKGSDFEILSDAMHLYNIYSYDTFFAFSLIFKIREKVDCEQLMYFNSQRAVITLFDALQNNGLGKMYFESLLNIAYKLNEFGEAEGAKQFDSDDWSWSRSQYGNANSCSVYTKKFIDAVNLYNRDNFQMGKPAMRGFIEELAKVERMIEKGNKIDKEQYISTINQIFDYSCDFPNEKTWNLLKRLSLGPGREIAEETLKELMDTSEQELDIMKYYRLYSEIH